VKLKESRKYYFKRGISLKKIRNITYLFNIITTKIKERLKKTKKL